MPNPSESGSSRPGPGSSLVSLRPADPPPTSAPDDAPTVITSARPTDPANDPTLGLAVGSRLGGFQIVEAIGAGGMAAVLKAKDVDLGRVVALKILPPHMARDPENVTRFKLEARAAAQLDHDNIARVFACGEDQRLNFIAFEFIEGETLRDLIDRRGQLPPAECVRYLAQVTAGLAHAADRGVVHRDVKPSNIVVTPDGRAKLVDMGLARSLNGGSVNGGVTQSGVTLGTFDYISPEQALDPRRADARSDIYSLGCTIYHALTGRPPVPPGTAAKKLQAHQNEPPVDPRLYNPQVPDALAAVLAKMMAKDPARRYQSPRELLAAAAGLATSLGLSADALPADARGSSLHAPLPTDAPTHRLSPGVAAGLAAVAVAVAVFVAVAGPGRGPAPTPPWDDPPPRAQTLPNDPNPPRSTSPPPVVSTVANPSTADDLATALENPAVSEVRLAAGKRYDLTALRDGVVAKPRPELTVTGDPTNPPTVVIAATPAATDRWDAPRQRSLTFHVTALTVRGVRFELVDGPQIDDPLTDSPADRPVGVLVLDADRATVDQCRFEPGLLLLQDLAGLAVARQPTADPMVRTALRVEHCYFGVRKGAGVQLAGAIAGQVRECGFAPHPAAVALRTDPTPVDRPDPTVADLDLSHCTFLLDKGAAVEADADAGWAITAGRCVFAAPPPDPAAMAMLMADPPPARPPVLRTAADPPTARFTGKSAAPNAYYGADPLSAAGQGRTFADLARRSGDGFADPAAVELKTAPWAVADPLARLDKERPWEAFRLATDRPELQAPRPDYLLGARAVPVADGHLYPNWPPGVQVSPPAAKAADPRVKVWWADPPDDRRTPLPANTYTALADALDAVESGDELHVRHDGPGELAVPMTVFDRPGLKLTVRPAPGSRVTLTRDRSDRGSLPPPADAALVRVADGEITLDGFGIRVSAPVRNGDTRTASAVAVSGGRVTLKNCTITLDAPADDPPRLSAVTVEPTDSGRSAVGVRLENTLVRGSGRAVRVLAARPCELALTDTVLAVAGPAVAVEPPMTTARSPGPPVRATLSRVTAALAGPVLDVRAETGGPWVSVDADRCVFAPVGPAGPLVTVAGADPDRLVVWTGHPTNRYANRPADAPYLVAAPADGPRRTWDAGRWLMFTRESADAVAPGVTFRRWPADPAGLAAAEPADFAVVSTDRADEPGAAGARVEQAGPRATKQ